MKKVIICGGFYDAKAEQVLKDKVVVVSDNKIEEVMDKAAYKAIPDAQVYDLSDRYVLPGMIDCHTHVAFYPMNYAEWLPGKIMVKGIANAKNDLLAGFTTLRDMAGAHFNDVAIRDAINAGEIWGPRMLVSGPGISPTFGHGDHHYRYFIQGPQMTPTMVADGPDEVRKVARIIAKEHVDHMKIFLTGGVGSIGDLPNVSKFNEAEVRAAAEVAQAEGLISGVHCYGPDGIKMSVRAGITSIEHGTMMDEECIELMVKHGTYLTPTLLAMYGSFDHPETVRPDSLAKAKIVTANHREMFALALKSGVKITFGTDAIGFEDNMHGQQAREFSYMLRLGMTAKEALRAATTTASSLLRMEDKIGSIEAGKFADIIAVKENPLEDITTMERVDFVMKDGEIYKQDGQALRRID